MFYSQGDLCLGWVLSEFVVKEFLCEFLPALAALCWWRGTNFCGEATSYFPSFVTFFLVIEDLTSQSKTNFPPWLGAFRTELKIVWFSKPWFPINTKIYRAELEKFIKNGLKWISGADLLQLSLLSASSAQLKWRQEQEKSSKIKSTCLVPPARETQALCLLQSCAWSLGIYIPNEIIQHQTCSTRGKEFLWVLSFAFLTVFLFSLSPNYTMPLVTFLMVIPGISF